MGPDSPFALLVFSFSKASALLFVGKKDAEPPTQDTLESLAAPTAEGASLHQASGGCHGSSSAANEVTAMCLEVPGECG